MRKRKSIQSSLARTQRCCTHRITFDGRILKREFWLYVWEVRPRRGRKFFYVGRTGDNNWKNGAQSLFVRMGHHLGFNKNNNMLRQYLQKNNIRPEECTFQLVGYGPVLAETSRRAEFERRRDVIAACERDLEKYMSKRGYQVNTVTSLKPRDERLFSKVRRAFAIEFPKLRNKKLKN